MVHQTVDMAEPVEAAHDGLESGHKDMTVLIVCDNVLRYIATAGHMGQGPRIGDTKQSCHVCISMSKAYNSRSDPRLRKAPWLMPLCRG
jgi:hypothetical protein